MLATAKYPEEAYVPDVVKLPRAVPVKRDLRAQAFTFDFRDRQGFEQRIDFSGIINAGTVVVVSITEVGVFSGEVLPFQGAASMEVHNVVPHNNGLLIVRGFIGWDADINVRLHILLQ